MNQKLKEWEVYKVLVSFIAGMFVGGISMTVVLCCMFASSKEDEETERFYERLSAEETIAEE